MSNEARAISEGFNDRILDIWVAKYKGELVPVRAPTFLHEDLFNGKTHLLFIGSNPSFSEAGFRSFLKGTNYQTIRENPKGFLELEISRSGSISLPPDFVDFHS